MLLAVKNGSVTPALFRKAANVYSYGMACFEILTGRIPFEVEGFRLNERDGVLEGYRPSLPSQTLGWMKALLIRCWRMDPSKRPTFREVLDSFEEQIVPMSASFISTSWEAFVFLHLAEGRGRSKVLPVSSKITQTSDCARRSVQLLASNEGRFLSADSVLHFNATIVTSCFEVRTVRAHGPWT